MTYIFLCFALVALSGPVYVLLHAVSLVIPLYLVLLAIGIICLFTLFGPVRYANLDDAFAAVLLLVGGGCSIIGFALSPLLVQGIVAALLLIITQGDRMKAQLIGK